MEGVVIGEETVLGAYVIVHPGTRLGRGVLVQDQAVLGKPPLATGSAGSSRRCTETFRPLVVGDRVTIGTGVICYSHAVIGDDAWLADRAIVREGVVVGSNVRIGKQTIIEYEATVGRGSRIQAFTLIGERMVVEEDVFIGPHVVTVCDRDMKRAGDQVLAPCVKRRARIGGQSVLAPGVTVGVDALVLAVSVVVRDVPDHAVVGGHPARPTKAIRTFHRSEPGRPG